ncbi:PEP-CTERM sorting domain-containing protein [Methyloversatilis thermotolerans]|uniref:PEP-CTERM sorting domain-containing protein n=1 Tax=Methyloversatilis thermotolerans TaxID=1346290 RepID=UPI00037A5698|nr:PEP-CTERM sorting domain-containing protein [Methyloversatilis thermotolerans]
MHLIKTSLALALASLGLNAQAAHFSLVSGSVAGSASASITYPNASYWPWHDGFGFSGTLDDVSGAGTLLGIGGGEASSEGRSYAWSHTMLLDAASDPSRLVIQAGHSFSLDLDHSLSTSGMGGGGSAFSRMLATLRVESDGEAHGSAVRVTFSGIADWLFSSALPSIRTLPNFSVVVRGDGNELIGDFSLATLAGDGFSFESTVGAELHFDISYSSGSYILGDGMTGIGLGPGNVGPGNLLESSGLIDGVLTVTAVPEPEQYALLLAGLGLIGCAARRRT